MKPLCAAVLTVMCGMTVCAQSDSDSVMDSNDLYYSVVNYSSSWVEVTYPGEMPRSMWEGHEMPSGQIIFPATIMHEGRQFDVREVDEWTFMGCKDITGVEFTEDLRSIGFSAFAFCEGLTSVRVPHSVTHLGGCSFFGCKNLKEVTLPAGLKALNPYVFADCVALRQVELPETLTMIDRSAFDHSGLESVSIPEKVIFIGMNAFRDCANLRSIEVKAIRPPALEAGSFAGVGADAVLYVPQGCADAYRAAEGWKDFQDIREQ